MVELQHTFCIDTVVMSSTFVALWLASTRYQHNVTLAATRLASGISVVSSRLQ